MSAMIRTVRVLVTAACAPLLVVGAAQGQTGRFEGIVRTASAGDPVVGARVTVVGTPLRATTSRSGFFVIDSVPVGTHALMVTAIGFEPATITDQRVSAGAATTVNYSLKVSVLSIEGVVVTGVTDLASALVAGETVDDIVDHGDPDQLQLVFRTHFDLAQFAEAQQWCDELRRFPNDYRSPLCRLWMLTTPEHSADVDLAWQLAGEVGLLAPKSVNEYFTLESHTVVGGVIARTGMVDSAHVVLTAARADPSLDPSLTLISYEAFMRILGGQYEKALELLEGFRYVNPERSFDFGGDLHWFWRPLRDDPRFEALRVGR